MSDKPEAAELKEYHGNCHCGAFKFSVKIDSLDPVLSCNCSICSKNGQLWVYPAMENLVIEKGKGSLKNYSFGSGRVTHSFCPKCGTSVMECFEREGVQNLGINARTLRDIDVDTVTVEKDDGKAREPHYQPPKPSSQNIKPADGFKVYDGNCHCQAITYTVETKPLSDTKVMSCNCSLCSRNGDLWIYPPKSAVKLQGETTLTDYAFLHKDSLHSFCSVCGVSVLVRLTDPKEDEMPINVRTIEGIDLWGLKLRTYDGKGADPQYRVE